ncbi:MAG: hypothetical protein IE918_04205 [Campylobacterales bacterium]|nr:hypothetical protein [Campylobacterales bacterium]
MKRWITTLSMALLIVAFFPSHSSASAALGKKIYKKKLHKACGFSSVKFARNHTQGEWEAIYEAGKFPQEAQAICPKLDLSALKSGIWNDLYLYVTKYALDGLAPNGCTD